MIRCAIIGWGENGEKIANALHFELKDTTVIGVATSNEAGKQYAMEKMGIKHITSNIQSILELHQVDIVCICTPGDEHLDHVALALKSGSNVFIDHPLASNVDDCKKLEKIISSFPSYKTLVAFPRRYDKRLRMLKNAIDNGDLGEITSIHAKTYEKMPPHEKLRKVHKGIFMDIMVHDVDLVRWLSGAEFQSGYVIGNAKMYPSLERVNDIDSAHALCKMSNGMNVSLYSSRICHSGVGYELTVTGTKGQVKIDALQSNGDIIRNQEGKVGLISGKYPENDYSNMLKEYIDAVRFGNRLRTDLEDATHATSVAVALTKSFVLNREITL